MGLANGIAGVAALVRIGGVGPRVMAVVAKSRGRPHDPNTLACDGDVLARMAFRAQADGYRRVLEDGATRVDRKGRNVLASPICLEVARGGTHDAFRRHVEIDGCPMKAPLASSGGEFIVELPRTIAKRVHNELSTSSCHPGLA